jgi:hypothetical protein
MFLFKEIDSRDPFSSQPIYITTFQTEAAKTSLVSSFGRMQRFSLLKKLGIGNTIFDQIQSY